jgi:hypothetical protein
MRRGFSKARLEGLVEEATIDAYGESEQLGGFYTRIDENLRLPFATEILGVEVMVEKVDLTDTEEIVAVCRRGTGRQRIFILDLPLPKPQPEGAEWIEAYRYWRRGCR